MKQIERMAKAREEALKLINLENAVEVGVGEYAVNMGEELGYVRIKVTAVKDLEYDAEFEAEEFKAEQKVKADKAIARHNKAEAEKALKLAAKAKREAAKEAKL